MNCTKRAYDSMARAQAGLASIRRYKPWRAECGYYQCDCGAWHLTSTVWSPATLAQKPYKTERIV